MDINLDTLIHIAADSVAQLRRCDVYRVLHESHYSGCFQRMIDYLQAKRPDLRDEVQDCQQDLTRELGVMA